jgi:hypothetical protein
LLKVIRAPEFNRRTLSGFEGGGFALRKTAWLKRFPS